MKHFRLDDQNVGCARPEQSESCVDAIELAHIDFVDKAVAAGWSEAEVAKAMLWRSVFHMQILENSDTYEDVRQVLRALFDKAA